MRKREWILPVVVIVFLVIAFSFMIAKPGDNTSIITANVAKEVEDALAENETVEVIVVLKDEDSIKSKDIEQYVEDKKEAVSIAQDEVITATETAVSESDFKVTAEYDTLNAFTAEVTQEGLDELRSNDNVEFIQTPKEYEILLDVSVPLINANKLWNMTFNGENLTGKGQTICVVDTGVDYTHPSLGNCTTEQFIAGNCAKVVGGKDTYNNDNDPKDDHGHGTHCAGIAASEDKLYRGVAPGAKLAAVKSLSSTGNGNSNTIASGIDWCVANAAAYGISVISMSIGTSSYHSATYCDSYDPLITAAINSARQAGIVVAVASGNEGVANGLSSPSCTESATPVGATDDNNIMASFSNTASILDIVSPGVNIYAPKKSGGFETRSGTSMATPHAAGAVALLQQYEKLTTGYLLTPSEIERILKDTGFQVYDSESGRNYSRLDLLAAINSFDKTPPAINFTAPTPGNGTAVNSSFITVNITSSEEISALLEWNGANESMNCSGLSCYAIKSGNGQINFTAYGKDLAGNAAKTETRAITISFNNTAPRITSFYPNQTNITITELDSQTFNITAEDADNNTLSYSWHQNGVLAGNLPEWIFAGNYTSAGTYNISAFVSDGFASANVSWTLNVGNVNSPPQLNWTIPNQEWLKNTNKTITLSNYFYDVDGDNIIYSSTAPQNITVNISNSTAILEPAVNFTGNNSITFYAFDAEYNATSNEVLLAVLENVTETPPVNETIPRTNFTAPVLSNVRIICSDLLNRTNGTLALNYTYFDAEGDNETAKETKWYLNGTYNPAFDNLSSIDKARTFKNQSWSASLRVYDSYNWSNWHNSSNITIRNSAPELDKVSNQEVDKGDLLIIEADAEDPDDDNLTYYINDSRFTKNGSDFRWNTASYWGGAMSFYVRINATDGDLWDSQEKIKISLVLPALSDELSGGGGGGGGAEATSNLAETKDNQLFGKLPAGENKITINKKDLPFTGYKFTTKSASTNVNIITESKSAKPSYASAPSGTVYSYITVSSSVFPDNIEGKVTIEFNVKKTAGYGKDTVNLLRYSDSWAELATSFEKETADYYYYTAESPGFSLFAITAEAKQQPAPVRDYTTMAPQQQTAPNQTVPQVTKENQTKNPVAGQATAVVSKAGINATSISKLFGEIGVSNIVLILVTIVAAVVVVAVYKRRQLVPKSKEKTKEKKEKPNKKEKPKDSSLLSGLKKIDEKVTQAREIKVEQPKPIVKIVKAKEVCSSCGSRNITKGFDGEHFCTDCGKILR